MLDTVQAPGSIAAAVIDSGERELSGSRIKATLAKPVSSHSDVASFRAS